MSRDAPVLVSQQQALWDYLDALLQEIPDDLAEEATLELAAETVEIEMPAALLAAAEIEIPAAALAAPAAKIAAPPKAPEPRTETILEPRPAAVAAAEEDPNGPPSWARSNFQALLFTVNGLTLAVPLIKLHSVVPWPREGVATMPAQPSWCYGLLRYREQNVRVVDTATLVIPDDKRAVLKAADPKHILVVGDGRWGLACSAVGEVVRLRPNEVKWRSRGGRRPWLSGTVLGHLCALMDTEAFADMLAERRG